jgi:hypothetical protein
VVTLLQAKDESVVSARRLSWSCEASTARNISSVPVLYEGKCHNQLCYNAAPFCHRIPGARVLTRSHQVNAALLSVSPCTASKKSRRGNRRVFLRLNRLCSQSTQHLLNQNLHANPGTYLIMQRFRSYVLYYILSSAISPFLSRDPQQHTSEKCNGAWQLLEIDGN